MGQLTRNSGLASSRGARYLWYEAMPQRLALSSASPTQMRVWTL